MASRLRILIADDNAGVVKSVSRLLALEHDVVGCVASGNALLEATQQLQPDLVVLDLSFTDVESLEACRRIKQRSPDIKVIVFTVDDREDVRRQAFEAGACGFVHKLLADELLAEVRRVDGKAK